MISHRQTKALFTVTTFVLLLLSLVAGLKYAGATDSSSVNLVAQIGGETRGVATYGQYAYVGVGPQLLIVNVANPLNPTVVHQTGPLSALSRPDEIIEDVTIVDETGYVYLAAGYGGFYILNVGSPSNPSVPTVVGHYDTDGYANAVDVSGNYAVVADDIEGIVVLDITNKALPAFANAAVTGDAARDVAMGSTGIGGEIYAFVAADEAGVEVYEIAPAFGRDGIYSFPANSYYYAQGITLNSALGQVYVAAGSGGLHIVDITNTQAPSKVASADTLSSAEDTAYFGNYVFVADGNQGVRIFDVNTPTTPSQVKNVVTPGYALAVTAGNNRVYLAGEWAGLRIVDFGNVNNAYEIGSYTSIGVVEGLAAPSLGDYLFSANGDMGLVSTDVSDRSNPAKGSAASTSNYAHGTALTGDYAYVAVQGGSLEVVDTAVPTNLSNVGSLATLDASLDVAVSGNYAYVADGFEGLFIADISNPTTPAYVTSLGTPDLPDAEGLDLSGNHAFVAGGTDGLHAVNVSNPAAPAVSDSLPLSGMALDVAVSGSYAYVAADNGGLQIVNVTDPGNMTWVSEVITPTLPNALGITVVGNYALVAAGYDGLIVLNVSNPAAPTVAGHYNTAGNAVSVAVNGAIYVGDVEGGLYILEFNNFDFGSTDLAVSMTDNATTAVAGTPLTYTITIANQGPSDVTGATVTDNFPAALTGVTWTCTADTGSTCNNASGAGNIASSINLEAGDTATFTAVGTISSSASGTLNNTATTAVPAGMTDSSTANNTANDSTTITAVTDLQVTLADTPDPVNPDAPLTYIATIHNAGPSDMTGDLVVVDTLPANVAFVSTVPGSPDCTHSGSVVTCSLNGLAASASIDVTILVDVAPTATTTLANEVTVSGIDTDPNDANNTATATTAIKTTDLSVSMLDAPDPVVAGKTLTYTLTVNNLGPNSATGVTLIDVLPAGVGLVTAVPGAPTCTETAGTVTCNLGDLAASASTQVSIVTAVDSATTGVLANTATVSSNEYDDNQTNNSASANTQVSLEAGLQISNSDGKTTIAAGEPLTYTITIYNAGPSDVIGASVADNLPSALAGVTWTCVASAGSTCNDPSGVGDIASSVDLQAGDTATFSATGTVASSASGALNNLAVVTAPAGVTDNNMTNNTANDSTTITAVTDLQVTLTGTPNPVNPGGSLTYEMTIHNAGPSNMTGNLVVVDTLPAAVTFVSAVPGSPTCAHSGGVVTCSLNGLAASASANVTIVVDVSPTANTSLVNEVAVSGSDTDPDNANNTATVTTSTKSADLAVTMLGAPDPVAAGETLTYTIEVNNLGPDNATGVTLTDVLPAGVGLVTAVPGAPTCTETAGIVTCNLGDLAASASTQVSIVVAVNSATTGTLANSVDVSANEYDGNQADNNAAANTQVSLEADLQISNTDGEVTIAAGAVATYTITIYNAGPSDVMGATVTDNFPAALTGVTWICTASAGSTCNDASGVGSVASSVDLQAGDTATFIAVGVITSSASGTLDNAATTAVPVGTTDNNNTNNTALDSTTITAVTDLQITSLDTLGPVIPSTPLTYTMTIHNAGPSDMTGSLAVVDTLPADVTFVSAAPGSPDCAHSSGVVTCSLSGLAASASANVTIMVDVAPTASTALVNGVTVSGSDTDPNLNNNTAAITSAVGTADLSVTVLDTPNPAIAGETLTYTIEVSNLGPDDATGVTLTDLLPAGVALVTAVPGAPTCTEVGGTVTCNLGDLAVGASTQVSIETSVGSSTTGTLSNTATALASEYDDNQTNDSATANTPVSLKADLQVSITDGTSAITAGEPLTYTITVHNAGPSAVSGAAVTDNFPADFTGVTWTCAGTGGGVCASSSGSGNIGAQVDLPVGGQAVFTAVGVVANTATGLLVNHASVAAPNGVTDPNVNNNTASDSDSLGAVADVSLTGTAVSASATINTQVTHVLTVTNTGPSAASGVVVNTILPANAEFVSSDDCTLNSGQVSCNIGTLAQGASATVSLVLKPLAKGTLTSQYTLFAVNDSTSGNNIAVINTTIEPYTVFLPVVIR